MLKFKGMKKGFFGVLAVALVFAWVEVGFCADPWADGDYRDLVKNISAWSVPEVVRLTGTTTFVVDLTKSKIIALDTSRATGGTTLYFTGSLKVPTHNYIIVPGNGYQVFAAYTTGYSPIVYPEATAAQPQKVWPLYPSATASNKVYVIEVMSGIGGFGGVAGSTVYVLSGVTPF